MSKKQKGSKAPKAVQIAVAYIRGGKAEAVKKAYEVNE